MVRTAFCKINLTLEILGTKRGDGFHDLKSIMHKIPLGDLVKVNIDFSREGINLICDRDVCKTQDNLAYKAGEMYLDLYRQKTKKGFFANITLTKITPTGAGLGGGSADGACVLDLLYESVGGLNENEVYSIAKTLGSDVPFCLKKHTCAMCCGRGEECTEISHLPKGVCLVIAKPKDSLETKGIYAEYDSLYGDDYNKSMSEKMKTALQQGDLSKISQYAVNDFEEICVKRLPLIDTIKEQMKKCGAVMSQMSGSGSAVFGLFENHEQSVLCKETIEKMYDARTFVFSDNDFQKMYKGE